jgi:very-short-patch-repair endonuclease
MIGLLVLIVVVKVIIEEIYYRYFYEKDTNENSSRQPTPEAKKLSNELVRLGYRAELEKWDGHKHIDIAIVSAKTNIEIDGSYHNYRAGTALRDLERTFYSLEKGYITIRIPNSLVRYKLTETVKYIDKILKVRNGKNINTTSTIYGNTTRTT